MKIHHAALYVNDLDRAKAFFEKYFGAVAGSLYHNRTTGFRSYFLTFSQGAQLELMHRPELAQVNGALPRTGFMHLAFSVGSREQVDSLTQRLVQDGYQVISGPRTTGDGYYESCVLDREGNQIEITI